MLEQKSKMEKEMKKVMILCTAIILAFAGIFAGCEGEKVRTPRVLPEDFRYEVQSNQHSVNYTDSSEKEISLYGMLWAPKAEGKFPAIILNHGFNGHYRDFPAECQAFAERGYVCYAYDFCGAQAGGLSTGRTASEYTPFTMKEDLRAAIANVKGLENVDETQIFLFGGSQGGFVTGLTAADDDVKEEVAAIAMYFPAFNIADDWRGKPVQNTSLMGYSIGAAFIQSVQELYPFDVIGNYEKDVCIVWGDQDALVRRQYIDGAVEAYGEDRVELTVIPGAGHGFGGTALNTAVETVLAFFEARTYEAI